MKSTKLISILVPQGAAALSCIEGSAKAFEVANLFLQERGQSPLFTVQLVGITTLPCTYDKYFTVTPDHSIETAPQSDLVIVPAVNGAWDNVISDNAPFLPWMVKQYNNGAEIASLCVGAFLLASTGLVDGKTLLNPLVGGR